MHFGYCWQPQKRPPSERFCLAFEGAPGTLRVDLRICPRRHCCRRRWRPPCNALPSRPAVGARVPCSRVRVCVCEVPAGSEKRRRPDRAAEAVRCSRASPLARAILQKLRHASHELQGSLASPAALTVTLDPLRKLRQEPIDNIFFKLRVTHGIVIIGHSEVTTRSMAVDRDVTSTWRPN